MVIRALATCVWLCWCGIGTPRAVGAQAVEDRFDAQRSASVRRSRDSTTRAAAKAQLRFFAMPRRDSSWWVPLASSILPGAGQAILGQDRFVAYLAAEGFIVLEYFRQTSEERAQRDRSRALARDVARAFFSPERPVGSWAYYESMEHFVESGVWNRSPLGEFSPEVDPSTYNGRLWLDLRELFWDNPNVEPAHESAAYRRALNKYNERAVQPEFRWSWRNAQLEQDLYRRSIRRKNAAAQAATNVLGFLVANHLLSTIDAFITVRLRSAPDAPGAPASLVASVPWAPFGRSPAR